MKSMTLGNENRIREVTSCAVRRLAGESAGSRLDFRHVSNHLNQKRPGYYLILLRTELKHRSLRDKPSLIG